MELSIDDLVRLVRDHLPPDGPFDEEGFRVSLQSGDDPLSENVEILTEVPGEKCKKSAIPHP